ncbi:hypothetical protein CPB84DRAFT_1787943 [Gymnopilus junonius]|uniref:C2H2-type domain-containing protein n=1 Tax=Gymnopilus junonius TaxID=109634 RepID=A0A9P5NIZ0_GYMJU|nr:hypothetical protein CPB84DRAFT_1787943 [Gymnopilus junonius]
MLSSAGNQSIYLFDSSAYTCKSYMEGPQPASGIEEVSPSAVTVYGVTFPDPSWHIVRPEVIDFQEGQSVEVDSGVYELSPIIPVAELSPMVAKPLSSQYRFQPIDVQIIHPQFGSAFPKNSLLFSEVHLNEPPFSSSSSRIEYDSSLTPSPASAYSFVQDESPASPDTSTSDTPSSVLSVPPSPFPRTTSFTPSLHSNSRLSNTDTEPVTDGNDVINTPKEYRAFEDSNGKQMAECLLCGIVVTRAAIRRHLLRQTHSERQFRCEVCLKEFTRDDRRKTHQVNQHGEGKEKRKRNPTTTRKINKNPKKKELKVTTARLGTFRKSLSPSL